LRPFLSILIVGLAFAGIVWAAVRTDLGTRFVAGATEAPAERRVAGFEAAVSDSRGASESLIDYGRIDARLRRLMEEPHMVGLAVAIVEDGEIRFLKGYGETIHGSGDQVGPDTVFRWASLSKGVAGDMVALLADQARLSLYDPVARYAPMLRLPGGAEHRATVSDLLSHRLGLFGHAYDTRLEDGEDPRVLRTMLAGLNAICAPGQCHAYQNVAYDAAADIVERVTGLPYPRAVEEHLFVPLGMTNASMTREALMAAPSWARPHVGGASPRVVEEITTSYYRVPAAGGVNGSIKDLALWMRAQMGLRTNVLPAGVLDAVQSPRADTPRENIRRRNYRERTPSSSYGLGWRVFDYAGNKVVGHHGGVRGYRSLIMFDPARRTGVAALWNSATSQPNGIEYEVMDMLYRLPFRDWLKIDDGVAAPEPADAAETIPEGGGA
jgi:beta-lactamase class C